MLEDPEKLASWIAETKKKFVYFSPPVSYRMIALSHLEKLSAENKVLRDSLVGFKADIDAVGAPSTISYNRNTLSDWIGHILQDCAEILRGDSKSAS